MPPDATPSHPLSDRFAEALAYAATLHRTQARKGTPVPYVAHLLAVAGLVLEYGGSEEQAIGGLLHDALEDQGIEHAAEIRRRFGDAVLAVVEGCSEVRAPEGAPKPDWRTRKEAYIAHVREEPAAIKLVSAADKVHNARTLVADYRVLGEELWTRFKGGREGTLWYYREMVVALREGEQTDGLMRLVDELGRVVEQLEALAGE